MYLEEMEVRTTFMNDVQATIEEAKTAGVSTQPGTIAAGSTTSSMTIKAERNDRGHTIELSVQSYIQSEAIIRTLCDLLGVPTEIANGRMRFLLHY
jgi:hypothetical protein